MKKRLTAMILSIAMAFSLLAFPAGAAESDDEYEGILEEYAETSAGFFYWLYVTEDDSDAYDAYLLLTAGAYGDTDITNAKDGEFFSATELGNEDDATSLDNLAATIRWLEECNELRQSDDNFSDLSDLSVSSLLMAVAELDVNWSSTNNTHALVFSNLGENLAWGYSDPFDGWYTAEKETYDSGESGTTGHYTNIVSSSYQATGFAYCTDGTYGSTHGQVFSLSSSDAIYTVEEYEALLDGYVSLVEEYLSGEDDEDAEEEESASDETEEAGKEETDSEEDAEEEVTVVDSGSCGDNLTWVLYSDGLLEISGYGNMTNWAAPVLVPWYDYCESITEVVISDEVTSIGIGAFENCTSLESITIPDSVTSIGNYAFYQCYNLTSITIGDSMTSVGDYAFYGCTNLTEICFTGDCPDFGEEVFGDVTAVVYYPSGNSTWTDSMLQDYGGDITWVAYDDEADSNSQDEEPEEDPSGSETDASSGLTYEDFTDLDDSTSWYYEGVSYVIETGIMNGTSSTTFSPDGTCTRSMIVTILYRLAGSPTVTGSSSFRDVEDGQWYTDAIVWAEKYDITTGTGDGTFNVNGTLTREQFATFLYRFAEYMGYDTSGSSDLDEKYPDYDEVDSWAEEALSWAVAEDLITGSVKNGETVLAPTDSCTRSMAAVIICRFAGAFEDTESSV